ncbi:MAG: DUF4956 domain-containing protein [Bacillota bacterium]|nr:DUF4956 domain-containing protein [Bacillota bacterium]
MDKALGFNDIIKKSVLKLSDFSRMSLAEIMIGLIISFLVALFIFYIYKKTFRGVVYSHSYNVSLILMSVITFLIIATISSNITLSLGMVGALSIVRFRTAIKDPMDIVFMFWAISVGISSGAGLYIISIIGSLFIGMILIIMNKLRFQQISFLLIIHHNKSANKLVEEELKNLNYKLKSRTESKNKVELTIEIKLKDNNTSFMEGISSIDGVDNAVLVNYNGDYAA